jgi:hypothetical protein
MGGEHVVIGGHDPDIRGAARGEHVLVGPHGGIGMGLISAGEMAARRAIGGGLAEAVKISTPGGFRAGADAVRDAGDGGMQRHGRLLGRRMTVV